MTGKARQILGLHEIIFDQLGTAEDRLKRGLKLMRDICGKFTTVLLGKRALGDIKAEKHRADRLAVRFDRIYHKAEDPSVFLGFKRFGTSRKRVVYGVGYLRSAHGGEKIISDTFGSVRAEKRRRRIVQINDPAVARNEHKSLAHARGYLRKLVVFALKLGKLRIYLMMLTVEL